MQRRVAGATVGTTRLKCFASENLLGGRAFREVLLADGDEVEVGEILSTLLLGSTFLERRADLSPRELRLLESRLALGRRISAGSQRLGKNLLLRSIPAGKGCLTPAKAGRKPHRPTSVHKRAILDYSFNHNCEVLLPTLGIEPQMLSHGPNSHLGLQGGHSCG